MPKHLLGLVIAATMLALNPAAAAQDREQELAMELVEAHSAPEVILAQIEAGGPEIIQAFRNNVPDLTEPEGDRIMQYFMEEMRALMPQFTRDFAAIYAEQFSEAELAALIEDPETTLDGRLVEVQPAITEQANALGEHYGQQAMQNAMPRIVELLENR